jgi:hypothetical protein
MLETKSERMDKAMQHNHGKSQEMQPFQGLREPFVVSHEASKAAHPGKTTLHHPRTGQQDKAALGIGLLFIPTSVKSA